jgi:hypothetical protein
MLRAGPRKYRCDSCDEPQVYGAEELLIMATSANPQETPPMSVTKTKIPADVIPILARSTIEDSVTTLQERPDCPTYLRVAKALTAARGKWNRKASRHVFPLDPRELIFSAVETGEVVDAHPLAHRIVELSGIGHGSIQRVLAGVPVAEWQKASMLLLFTSLQNSAMAIR